MGNLTMVTGFLLMDFSNTWELQVLHAMLFLLIYLVALMGNLFIFTLISLNSHLHTPIYFFLKKLSFLNLCFFTVIVLKSASHVFLEVLFIASDIFLLTAMSFDHYVAICQPLHYATIMKREVCVWLVTLSWLSGALFGTLYSVSIFSLPFCGSKEVHQFFCDVPSLLRISFSDTHTTVYLSIGIGFSLRIFCCISIIILYSHIFPTVLKIPTTEGRSKAFSTCLHHLIVFIVFVITSAMAYLKPLLDSDLVLDLLLSIFYTVVPPTLNPLIYTLRNKDIKISLKKLMTLQHSSKRLIQKSFP
ncbi:olfactory receptor 14A2-like [Gracilinanus agilis]|uniref:olfactory receptor 14A2-like n=1 Tax=Gracilinanus agilis TaxID=191870 RepID=UPI001CFE1C8B|nr:olfactory receptor 14A2-like [Gracilinanus agilis]